MLEGYSALAYAAALTKRIELGTLVTGATYRHPGLLAKTVTTLDVVSGGRAWLGIGTAWNEGEHRGLGVPYPPVSERFERLVETLRLVATYADACNLFDAGPEAMTGRLDIFRRHCDDVGRNPREIEVTALSRLTLGPAGGTSVSGEPFTTVDEAATGGSRRWDWTTSSSRWATTPTTRHTSMWQRWSVNWDR